MPVRKWIAQKEYNLSETEKLLSQKLESIDPNKIVQPEMHIAVPALQAISYSMDNEELRNLYANLLSKSMNVDTKNFVHPAFVEIIKQLSPLDAKVLNIICTNKVNPLIDISLINRITGGVLKTLQSNFTNIDIENPKLISISIENLKRLNLIDISDDTLFRKKRSISISRIASNSVYSSLYETEYYKDFEAMYRTEENVELDVQEKFIKLTDIGKSFYEICCEN